jgi:outer membrane protein, heavy metal efflux system
VEENVATHRTLRSAHRNAFRPSRPYRFPLERWFATATGALLCALELGALALPAAADEASPDSTAPSAERILASIDQQPLRSLLVEILDRNPEIAAQGAAAAAAWQRPRQGSALPDPNLAATVFALQPETRVGPQQVMLTASERFPWFGKRGLRGETAEHAAQGMDARLQSVRLRTLTEARRLYYDLSFLAVQERIVREDRATLEHYEEVARARYASGVGLEQSVVKIQAEITKADTRLLDIKGRQATLQARLNALRDRPDGTPVDISPLPRYPQLATGIDSLREQAVRDRPEVEEAGSLIDKAAASYRLAKKEGWPDFTLGVTYTFVGDRTDPAGIASPPPDNGQDVLGFIAGVNVPLWRGKISSGVQEAVEQQRGAEESRRAVLAGIDQSLGDLVHRMEFTWERLRLFEDVLVIQAGQSLSSAEAGYSSGTLNALDLLDAERVLLDVRVTTARTLADYAIGAAELEGAVGAPVLGMEER